MDMRVCLYEMFGSIARDGKDTVRLDYDTSLWVWLLECELLIITAIHLTSFVNMRHDELERA